MTGRLQEGDIEFADTFTAIHLPRESEGPGLTWHSLIIDVCLGVRCGKRLQRLWLTFVFVCSIAINTIRAQKVSSVSDSFNGSFFLYLSCAFFSAQAIFGFYPIYYLSVTCADPQRSSTGLPYTRFTAIVVLMIAGIDLVGVGFAVTLYLLHPLGAVAVSSNLHLSVSVALIPRYLHFIRQESSCKVETLMHHMERHSETLSGDFWGDVVLRYNDIRCDLEEIRKNPTHRAITYFFLSSIAYSLGMFVWVAFVSEKYKLSSPVVQFSNIFRLALLSSITILLALTMFEVSKIDISGLALKLQQAELRTQRHILRNPLAMPSWDAVRDIKDLPLAWQLGPIAMRSTALASVIVASLAPSLSRIAEYLLRVF